MSLDQKSIDGAWEHVKQKVHERWGHLTDEELEPCRGNLEQLVGRIDEKTAEAREEVERYLEAAVADEEGILDKASDAVVERASQAAEAAHQAAAHVSDSARNSYVQTRRMVQNRPAGSLAVCFGVGVVTGLVFGLLVQGK